MNCIILSSIFQNLTKVFPIEIIAVIITAIITWYISRYFFNKKIKANHFKKIYGYLSSCATHHDNANRIKDAKLNLQKNLNKNEIFSQYLMQNEKSHEYLLKVMLEGQLLNNENIDCLLNKIIDDIRKNKTSEFFNNIKKAKIGVEKEYNKISNKKISNIPLETEVSTDYEVVCREFE